MSPRSFTIGLILTGAMISAGVGEVYGAPQDTIVSETGAVVEGAAPDTTRGPTLREQVLQKLRALETASRPQDPEEETATEPDSVAAVDSLTRPDTATAPDSTLSPDSLELTEQTATAEPSSERSRARRLIPDTDSIAIRLRNLEGYQLTEYRAASARYSGESGHLELKGESRLARGTESMEADSLLRYDQSTAIICGYGSPVLSGTGNDPVESDQVCYDIDRQVGVAMGARTTFSEQGTWFIHGNELYTSGTDRVYGAATSFTSCDLDEPHYHFSAREVKVVHENIMVARNVTLKFADVPVFWLPFLAQSLKPDRRSGLLTPTIGLQHVVRTSSGYRREIRDIGFYWALNDHLGLTSAIDWQSGGYIALRGRLQYRWLRQFLNGDISFSRYWELDHGSRFALTASTNWQPGERTSLRTSINYASSSDFVRRYSVDPEELNRSIDSNVGINHRFTWGSLNLSGSRRQHLSDDRVDMTLPSVSLSLDPITLFENSIEPKWYNNATWQNSLTFNATSREVNYLRPNERGQNTSNLRGSASSRLTLGKLGLSADFNFDEAVRHHRPTWYDPTAPDTVVPDSITFERAVDQTMAWRAGMNFTQRLIENTTLSPSVTISGGLRMRTDLPDSLGVHGQVEEPTRVNFGTSLRTNIYGFWPGIGPYSRIRHRLEPSLSYTYSPEPKVTDLQRRAFGTRYDGLRETNSLQLTLSQTFEAKPIVEDDEPDSASADTVSGAFGEVPPRRKRQVSPITLLSVSSSALLYDFVRAREGEYGLTTTQMTHNIHSDLVPGLRLNVGHDLWDESNPSDRGTSTTNGARRFSPRLRSLSANFSLSSDSWPFRLFSGGGGEPQEQQHEGGTGTGADEPSPDDQADLGRSVIPGRPDHRQTAPMGGQAVGTWRGNFSYSLTKPPAGGRGTENQFLRFDLSFQPTEKWSVNWSSSYSITAGEFADHILTLNRDLHRWRATFYFSKTQFGSFTFRLNVQLLDNPDIKVDYDHRSPLPPPEY